MDNTTINEWMQEGVQLHLAGNRAGAETKYRQILAEEETNPVAHNNLGFLLAQNGQLQEALDEYCRAIELSPEYSTPYSNLGQAYLALNRLMEAGTNLTRALQLDPDDLYAHEGMSKLCLLTGDLAGGEKFLRKSYSLEPKNEILYQLILCLLGQGKIGEAKDILEVIGNAGHDDVRWHNLSGLAHFRDNNFGEARRCFRRALGLAPENTEIRNSLVAVLLKTGDREEAMLELRRILLLEPRHAEALINLGVLLLMSGQLDEGLESLESALETEPGNIKAMFYKAMTLVRLKKKPATARALLQKVIGSKDASYSAAATGLLEEIN